MGWTVDMMIEKIKQGERLTSEQLAGAYMRRQMMKEQWDDACDLIDKLETWILLRIARNAGMFTNYKTRGGPEPTGEAEYQATIKALTKYKDYLEEDGPWLHSLVTTELNLRYRGEGVERDVFLSIARAKLKETREWMESQTPEILGEHDDHGGETFGAVIKDW